MLKLTQVTQTHWFNNDNGCRVFVETPSGDVRVLVGTVQRGEQATLTIDATGQDIAIHEDLIRKQGIILKE